MGGFQKQINKTLQLDSKGHSNCYVKMVQQEFPKKWDVTKYLPNIYRLSTELPLGFQIQVG